MASKASIVSAISSKISGTKFSIWRIGITENGAKRKTEWRDKEKQNVDHWSCWQADSATDAKDIEAHFIAKGMKGGTGGDLSGATRYVYVF